MINILKYNSTLEDYYKRIETKGVLYCAGKAVKRILYSIICYTAGFLAYPICRLGKIKFILLTERAIGHLCVEPDCYIKEEILGLRQRYNTIMLAPARKIANEHLLDYWEKYLRVIRSPWLCVLLEPLAKNRLTGYNTYRFCFSWKAASFPEIQKRYHGRSPLLVLTESDRQRGRACLRKLGMEESSWFVCVHGREDGYLGDVNQSMRNVDINNYILAMETVVERGGWVIRMGDPTMKPILNMPHVIDYAHLDIKSDWMDIFLCASCRFFLGSNSGLYHAANVFGVPVIVTNNPHIAGALPYGVHDIGIPKLVWSEKEERYLSFKEVLRTPVGHFRFDTQFKREGLRLVENEPEDLRGVVLEMFEKISGHIVYTAEDEKLQTRFKSLLTPRHFSYGGMSRIGRNFLRKYSFLLND